MKILFCVTKSEYGGVSTHVFQLSRELVKRGHTVGIVSSGDGWLREKVRKLGVVWFDNVHFRNSYSPLRLVKSVMFIRSVAKSFNPDVVSLHSSIAGVDGRLALLKQVPIIFTAHGWAFTRGVPLLRRCIAWIVEALLVHRAQKVICVSMYDFHIGTQLPLAAKRMLCIHNGVEGSYQKADPERSNVVVSVGRFVKQKKQEVLARVADKNQLKVFFIGNGPRQKRVEDIVNGSTVNFVGAVPREDVGNYLAKAGVFVLVANWEGFPRAILEAMSAGLPVIASDVGGVSEIVDDSVGVLLKKNSEQELEHALLDLLNHPEKRKQMGENARKRIEQEFSLERMIEKTFGVYEEVIGKRV